MQISDTMFLALGCIALTILIYIAFVVRDIEKDIKKWLRKRK